MESHACNDDEIVQTLHVSKVGPSTWSWLSDSQVFPEPSVLPFDLLRDHLFVMLDLRSLVRVLPRVSKRYHELVERYLRDTLCRELGVSRRKLALLVPA